jgi:AraC-like DNA-binding protein
VPLRPFVQQYWITTWDRRERPAYVQRILPGPSVNLTLKRGRSRIAGLSTGLFTEVLEDCHVVFGVQFRPGGFRPVLGSSVETVTDRFLPLREVFGPRSAELDCVVLEAASSDERVAAVEEFLFSVLPEADPMTEVAAAMVAEVSAHHRITRVDQLARRCDVGVRQVQRLFANYVGASPKWVLRRRRIQVAAFRAAYGSADWAGLAADLGYYDQGHFCRDFTANVGVSPAAYRHLCAQASELDPPGYA